MANPEKVPVPDQPELQRDSLNSDVFEPTDLVIDTTVRPMRESLRKRLKQPANGQQSHEPPTTPSR
jgi:hypothetical protein